MKLRNKFKHSKCKNYAFPRLNQDNNQISNNQNVAPNPNKSQFQTDDTDHILLSKNYVFDYKAPNKDVSKINRKNIEFFTTKQENTRPPKRLTLMKTFDEDNKHMLSKSMPRTSNNSKSKKTKHKRQTTLFKFDQEDNSCDRAKHLIKTNSSLSVTSHSSRIDNLNSK